MFTGFGFFTVFVALLVVYMILSSYSMSKPEEITKPDTKPCKWNNNQVCPYGVMMHIHSHGRRIYLKDGSMGCCKVRQTSVKIAKGVLDGSVPSSGNSILESSQRTVDRHKELHPEEHEFLFGTREHNE